MLRYLILAIIIIALIYGLVNIVCDLIVFVKTVFNSFTKENIVIVVVSMVIFAWLYSIGYFLKCLFRI